MKNNLTGQRFGRLIATQLSGNKKWGCFAWLCTCDCGRVVEIASNTLRSGYTRSCGCLRDETTRARSLKHGGVGSPTYKIWDGVIQRCTNPRNASYPKYGGAGITLCEQWRDYTNFLKDMGERPSGLTIDRIDTLKGYEPGNCRWATYVEQAHNKRIACTTFARAEEVRTLRETSGKGPKGISDELGVPRGSVSGIIYLDNIKSER